MRSSSDKSIKKRKTDCHKAEDRECNHRHSKKLCIVGIGPGDVSHMSARAREVIEAAETVAGYSSYIDLIRPLVKDKTLISTGMKKEVNRVKAAIDSALSGQNCVLVSSGDPGIYAMAGLVFEMCEQRDIPVIKTGKDLTENQKSVFLQVEVVPGIPALASCAALLGAPLTHDFAVISLSDLLTPWEVIEKRIQGAALADFVIVIFNPKSKKRDWQLKKARDIILEYRDEKVPVGIVKNAMRENEAVEIRTLKDLDQADVDMLTTVIIGNSTTREYNNFMITPRGYSKKYKLKQSILLSENASGGPAGG